MKTKFKDLKGTPDFAHFPIRQYPFLLSYTHYSVHSYTIHKSDMPPNELLCMLLCYCATVLVTFVAKKVEEEILWEQFENVLSFSS